MTCGIARVIDAMRGPLVILALGPSDVGHEALRVAVVERKPTALNLHHNPMPRQERMIHMWQCDTIGQNLASGNRLRGLEAFTVTTAEDISRHHQLKSSHLRSR